MAKIEGPPKITLDRKTGIYDRALLDYAQLWISGHPNNYARLSIEGCDQLLTLISEGDTIAVAKVSGLEVKKS